MDIVELIYRPTNPQGHSKDFEFSRTTMRARWEQGLSDARTTLLASPWLAPMPPEVGARTFDVLKETADVGEVVVGRCRMTSKESYNVHSDETNRSCTCGILQLACRARLCDARSRGRGQYLASEMQQRR
jgi:hypothetical protein